MKQLETSRVTIDEVAKRARVSISTVSRVINGLDRVHPATRQRVLDAVQALNYQPSALAKGLATQQTRSLGFVIPTISDPFYLGIVRGVEEAAAAVGHNLLVASQAVQPDEPCYKPLVDQRRIDAMVVVGIKIPDADLRQFTRQGLPIAFIQQDAGELASSFLADNYGGAQTLAEHLLTLGHRHFAYIAGSDATPDSAERLRGLQDALLAAGSVLPEAYITRGTYLPGSGYEAMLRLLDLNPRPEAVFAANDQMAVDAILAIRECGLRVPEDIAVVGFDDVPMAGYVTPPLTTVRQPTYELGFQAASSVLDATNLAQVSQERSQQKSQVPTRTVLPTELVIRRSCGSLA